MTAVMETEINKRLNQLVLDFKVDYYNPGFKIMVSAEELIAKFTAEHSYKPWVMISRCKADTDFFCKTIKSTKDMPVYLYDEINDAVIYQLQKMKNSHFIMIISYYGWQEVNNNLYNHGLKPLSIYDYFTINDLICNGNYYDVFRHQYYEFHNGIPTFDYSNVDLSSIFFYDRRCYETMEFEHQKSIYLSKMIFDCVYARDFGLLEHYIIEYSSHGYEGYDRYEEFLKRIKQLLSEIKGYLERREAKDIVMFWLDALESGDDSDMPYLKSLADCSMDFENAYTVTPYTNSTAKALFHGKYLVDDQAFRLKVGSDSRLATELNDYGYKIRFYTLLEQVDGNIRADKTQSIYMPLSMMCWSLLCDLLSSNQAIFAILHEIFHTHMPYGSLGLTGSEYSFSERWGGISEYEQKLCNSQIEESRRATDQVLRFYSGLLNERMYKIYMSDHGHTYLDKHHTIFRVIQKDIAPQRVHKLFSYVHFCDFITCLLEQKVEFPYIFSEYIKIQDVDYYYENYIKYLLSTEQPDLYNMFGYVGLITDNEYYVRYNDGREEYYNHKSGQNLQKEQIEYLRSICPEYPKELINNSKFKYSRLVYETLENYMKRNKSFEDEKKLQIISLFESIPKGQNIALRGGGWHTYHLWLVLPWELRRRITYVIDANKACMAARFGIRIISLEEIRLKSISVIVISSFEHEKEWLEKLTKLSPGCEVIGLYSYLKKQGVVCQRAFYHKEYKSQDIPFMEVNADV